MPDEPYSHFEDRQLDNDALLAIGRIVRACAELEDMLTLFICNLAEISEGKALIMLGRTPFSARSNIAHYLAKMNSQQALEIYRRTFESSVKNGVECRNAVAHGILLGLNQNGEYGFLTSKTSEPEGSAAIQLVACYSTKTLQSIADALEVRLPSFENILKIGSLRDKRRGQSLQGHRKGQARQQRSAKQKPRPQS